MTLPLPAPQPHSGIHLAIIMDGNGRWARARGLPRTAGHKVGVAAARRVVEAAARAGIGTLTLYAFSADNWSRPTPEVTALMRLLRRALLTESRRCLANDIRISMVGRRDRLGTALTSTMEQAEAMTAECRGLHLRIAVDYSARDSILRAAALAGGRELDREQFNALLGQVNHDAYPVRDVDLLVRTGGEQRLSDFLLWECAYAEFVFSDRLWPDFTEGDLSAVLEQFTHRERRFGGVPAQAAS
jgi:undecaprenyl diphosphate synthase